MAGQIRPMDGPTAHVEPGGAVLELRDGPFVLRKRSVEEMDNDVYLLGDAGSGRALLVDAAARADLLLAMADGFEVVACVQTHGHWDHVRAWDDLVAAGVPVWGHAADTELFPHAVDRALEGGEVLSLGEVDVEVLHTPGHTPGSLQYLVRAADHPHLCSGDSLFPGGPGNTWGDAERFDQLMTHLETQVFGGLPDTTWVHPGHGDGTTLGTERPNVAEWRDRGW